MTASTIDKKLRAKIRAALDVDDSRIDATEALFSRVIRPELQKNYLSHLKTAIEDLINERKTSELKANLVKEHKDPRILAELDKMILSKRFRPFAIILTPLASPVRKASTRPQKNGNGAVVYYMSTLDPKEKRVLIAHELSHIALKMLSTAKNGTWTEKEVNLLALVAMRDKNEFYRRECETFTYGTDDDLIAAFKSLCIGGIK